ncbi:DUF932 domain-containing protein [Variovorax paradoxus]|nr:DUF932 domain-containing protein [Variovorax paradoxus]MBT2304028.1 DUF932 domain-containing protein [Variovorax paradoxus]
MTQQLFNHFAFAASMSLERLAERVPAAFAEHAAESTGPRYVFISTREIVSALMDAGFAPTHATQTAARHANAAYARHLLRFQPVVETVSLRDALPQIVLINSHDGRSAYQLRAGLFRPVCTNGLMTPIGDFGLVHVSHRGNVVRNVVEAALQITGEFSRVGDAIECMSETTLSQGERLAFAEAALALRYAGRDDKPVQPAQLLETRRIADVGDDVWRTFNAVQENVMRGGLCGRSALGRAVRTRGIRAIREDVRINTGLWKLALQRIGR